MTQPYFQNFPPSDDSLSIIERQYWYYNFYWFLWNSIL